MLFFKRPCQRKEPTLSYLTILMIKIHVGVCKDRNNPSEKLSLVISGMSVSLLLINLLMNL